MEYTEHEKLKKVSGVSQEIGVFIEWLGAKEMAIAEYNNFNDFMSPTHKSIPDLLAGYFGIDQKRLEDEKQHMIDNLN